MSLPGRVPIVRHRKRASPFTVIPSEREMMSEEKRLARKDHRSRSPTPASFLPDFLPDALEKTKDTMDDARECAPLVHTPLMRNGALASTTRESTSRARHSTCHSSDHVRLRLQMRLRAPVRVRAQARRDDALKQHERVRRRPRCHRRHRGGHGGYWLLRQDDRVARGLPPLLSQSVSQSVSQ